MSGNYSDGINQESFDKYWEDKLGEPCERCGIWPASVSDERSGSVICAKCAAQEILNDWLEPPPISKDDS
jgi:hypothetical protein